MRERERDRDLYEYNAWLLWLLLLLDKETNRLIEFKWWKRKKESSSISYQYVVEVVLSNSTENIVWSIWNSERKEEEKKEEKKIQI